MGRHTRDTPRQTATAARRVATRPLRRRDRPRRRRDRKRPARDGVAGVKTRDGAELLSSQYEQVTSASAKAEANKQSEHEKSTSRSHEQSGAAQPYHPPTISTIHVSTLAPEAGCGAVGRRTMHGRRRRAAEQSKG